MFFVVGLPCSFLIFMATGVRMSNTLIGGKKVSRWDLFIHILSGSLFALLLLIVVAVLLKKVGLV